jgi:hypothetical protein
MLNVSSTTGSYLGGTAPVFTDGGIIALEDLLQNRTIYVRPDGNDANDGMANTAARAFLTINAAVNYLSKLPYNPLFWTTAPDSGFNIQIANGTYAETINLRDVRAVGATIKGDEVTPGNVIINGVSDGLVAIGLSSKWFIRGVRITAAAGSCLRLEQGSVINYRNVEFGAATAPQIDVQSNSTAIADGNYSIIGAAPWHLYSRLGSVAQISNRTITVTGTPAFANAFVACEDVSLVRATSVTFSGSATGKRYDVATNGVINTNGGGASYFPGGTAGTTATGGQYV